MVRFNVMVATCVVGLMLPMAGGAVSAEPTDLTNGGAGAERQDGLGLGGGESLAPTSPYGEFTPLTPARILDTRTGDGRNGVIAPLGESTSFPVQITGRGGVADSGVAAVVMNVTVTEPTASSHLRLWPAGEDRPLVASLNFVAGQTVPNLVTVAVGANGQVNVYNRFGSTHVIFDVVGFYADDDGPAGSRFHAIAPFRYFDTRIVDGGPFGPLGPDSTYEFNVLGHHDVPSSGVTAVMLNVAITEPTARSFLTVFPGDVATRPLAANQNYVPGLTRSNQVIVRVPSSGVVKFYNRFGSVHLVVDAVGYFDEDRSTEAGRFIPLVPYRAFDSREDPDGPWGPDEAWDVGTPPGFGGWTSDEAESVVLNVTATQPTQRSYLTVFPSHLCDVPLAASLNFGAGQTVPNHVVVRLGENGQCSHPDWLGTIAVYNRFGNVHIVLDMFGFFTAQQPLESGTPVLWGIQLDDQGPGVHTITMIVDFGPVAEADVEYTTGKLVWDQQEVALCGISIRGDGIPDGHLGVGDIFQTTEGCGVNPSAMQDAFDQYGLPETACVAVKFDDLVRQFCAPLIVL